MAYLRLCLCVCGWILFVGCGEPPAPPAPPTGGSAAVPPPPPGAPLAPAGSSHPKGAPPAIPSPPTAGGDPVVAAPGDAGKTGGQESSNDKVAEVGVGAKGQKYSAGGYLSGNIRAMHRTEERLAFMNAQKALDMYKATHGRGPKTHDEYMNKIIKRNGIVLPELNEGEHYLYRPEKEELVVVGP